MNGYCFRGGNCQNHFLSSEKRCTLKEKNLLPNYFILEKAPFQKELDALVCKQEVTKVVSLMKYSEKILSVS